jgi:hypothetical protein
MAITRISPSSPADLQDKQAKDVERVGARQATSARGGWVSRGLIGECPSRSSQGQLSAPSGGCAAPALTTQFFSKMGSKLGQLSCWKANSHSSTVTRLIGAYNNGFQVSSNSPE